MSDVKQTNLKVQESLVDCVQESLCGESEVPVKPPRRKSTLGIKKVNKFNNQSSFRTKNLNLNASVENEQYDKVINSSENIFEKKIDLPKENYVENSNVIYPVLIKEPQKIISSSIKNCSPKPKPRRNPPPIPLLLPNAKPVTRQRKSLPGTFENLKGKNDQVFDQPKNVKPKTEVVETFISENKKSNLTDGKNKKSTVSVLRSKSIKWAEKLGIQKKETASRSHRRTSDISVSTIKQEPAFNGNVKKAPPRPQSFTNLKSSKSKKRPPRPPPPVVSKSKNSQNYPHFDHQKKIVDVKMKSFISSQGEFVALQNHNDFTQLEFKKGDHLFVMKELGNGLVFGRNEISGEEGAFPLKMAHPLVDEYIDKKTLEKKFCSLTKPNDISSDENKHDDSLHLNDYTQIGENEENLEYYKNIEVPDTEQIRNVKEVDQSCS